ncbi:MAG: fused MFS/spermidine synthase [Kiloniellales bacterium]|nr:fused MFS/spermidine synthase [Kiloniellales bacterium]
MTLSTASSSPWSPKLLYGVFFFSGFPALLYQLVWQRKLFTIYGVNIESITVVVTAFMLGLGFGALLGGALSRLGKWPPLIIFAGLELGIGLFGFGSLRIFDLVAAHTLGATPLYVFLITFGLVLLPTLLMGATLPVLVGFLIRQNNSVGQSVGMLYFVNTLGAAAACILTGFFIFALAGLSGTVASAATLNLLIAAGAVLVHVQWGKAAQGDRVAAALEARPAERDGNQRPLQLRRLALALLLVGLAGFVSLSYEILWARYFLVAAGGHPKTFPIFLGFYLAGIAYGALLAHRHCRRDDRGDRHHELYLVAKFLLAANVVGFLVLPALSWTLSWGLPMAATLLWVAAASAMLGAALPLLSHYAVNADDRAGSRVSLLYLANIIGSASGSLVTGFVLMEFWSAEEINLSLGLTGLLLCAGILITLGTKARVLLPRMTAVSACALAMIALSAPLFSLFYERLHFRAYAERPEAALAHRFENRSGVVVVTKKGTVLGGGVYDGVISTGFVKDQNQLFRPYALSAFHPAPRHVLSIGIGSGSWAQVLAHHPDVEKLTIIEINSGYIELLGHYQETRSLLDNPKVEFIVDDGRRWLAANPDRRFDVIVANTTFHWRAYAANLLSREFFEIVRANLKDGGIYYFNTTHSAIAQRTAATAFPHALRFGSMIVASDSPIRPDPSRLRETLLHYRIDGRAILDLKRQRDRERLEQVITSLQTDRPYTFETRGQPSLESKSSILDRTAQFEIATDDNMATEWVPDQVQENPDMNRKTWLALFR